MALRFSCHTARWRDDQSLVLQVLADFIARKRLEISRSAYFGSLSLAKGPTVSFGG